MTYLIDPRSLPGGDADPGYEWYTPAGFLDAARRVFGGPIDLDPASCEYANRVVQAARYFTEADDGLAHSWHADRLWCNPPYGKTNGASNQGIWLRRLIAEYHAGRVREAIMLVTAATDMKWFRAAWDYAICFLDAKVHFYGPRGQTRQHPQGACCLYFGEDDAIFLDIFSAYGPVVPAGAARRRGIAGVSIAMFEEDR